MNRVSNYSETYPLFKEGTLFPDKTAPVGLDEYESFEHYLNELQEGWLDEV
jgi:hypothetical protein